MTGMVIKNIIGCHWLLLATLSSHPTTINEKRQMIWVNFCSVFLPVGTLGGWRLKGASLYTPSCHWLPSEATPCMGDIRGFDV